MPITHEVLSTDLEDIVGAVEAYKRSDAGSAAKLVRKLEAMKMHVEGPEGYLFRMRYQPLLNLCVTIALESGMLKAIVQRHGAAVHSHDIALETGQDEVLVMRVMRQLYVNGVCDERGPATFASNEVSEMLDTPEHRGAAKVCHEPVFHVGTKIREQVHSPGIQMFADKPGARNPCHYTFGKKWFEVMQSDPELRTAFDQYMVGRRSGILRSWVDTYPAERLLLSEQSSDRVTVVDVGGGVGTDLMSFCKKFKDRAGRTVLEDLPHVIEKRDSLPDGIEKIGFNFFTMAQPIKGARAYFMHAVIHDWSDEQARTILRGTVEAMSEDSVVLIQDMVLGDTECTWRGSTLDISMLMFPGGMERTQTQWESLLSSVGLRICKVWSDEQMVESVIEARLQ